MVMAVADGLPWADIAPTELQLTYGSLIVDRYALSAADVEGIKTSAARRGAARCKSKQVRGAKLK